VKVFDRKIDAERYLTTTESATESVNLFEAPCRRN
jgi:hypothetical protein